MQKTTSLFLGIKSKILCCFLMLLAIQLNGQDKKEPLLLDPGKEAYVLRCFAKQNDKVKTHSIAVGDPVKINYLYDSETGSLLKIWKGEFVDVAPMWIDRGGGFFKTPASTKDISDVPVVASLNDNKAAWPDSATFAKGYKFKGYKVDKAGRPTFMYTTNNLKVEDKIQPADGKDGITREISVSSDNDLSKVYLMLAEGTDIKKNKNSYTVSGKNYTLKIEDSGKAKPIIRDSNGRKELLVPVDGGKQAKVKYLITL